MSNIINFGGGATNIPTPFKPEGKSYLTFSSPNSFTLAVNDTTKHWNGTLEYFASNKTWTVWAGTTTLSAVDNDGEYVLYLRGTGNTVITGNNIDFRWVLTGNNIKCIGNIENLLGYTTVQSGNHPTMSNHCYNSMFSNCTSLTQAPELPATTLATGCYNSMFEGCTALTKAPALPATTLANNCYNSMFQGCTSLTQAPALPATTLANGCYHFMFSGCISLTKAPALPATTLASGCYEAMFQGCTALIQVPELPVTTLEKRCYLSMFDSCTSLKLSTTQTGEYTQEYRIPSSGTGTTQSGSLTGMFTSTGGTFTGNPSINTTYYLSTDNMIVRDTEVATLNGYVGSMIDVAIGGDSVSATLHASSWNANAKTQTVSVSGVTATSNGSLRIAQSATDEQFTAWGAAQPRVTAQAAGTLTVKVAGTVPTIDIPVEVLIV